VNEQLLQRITINPKVMAGKPVIRGTRVPVELIVRMLSQGLTEGEILREYPRLEPEDIRAALLLLAEISELNRPKSKEKTTIWVQIFTQYPVAYASQVLAFEEVTPLSVAA
jgi:uncharacterized protein (DUF433 family)